MIAILNYGLGNVAAFANIFKRLDVAHSVVSRPEDLADASKLILPGVGAFDHAMTSFEKSGMASTVRDLVFVQRIPVLGVCVGMQMMADSSEEGSAPGLGWVPGRVRKLGLDALPEGSPLPHMGWNDLRAARPTRLLDGLEEGARFYFLHSYYFDPLENADVIGTTDYSSAFCCAVQRDNIFGVQFHPEKSHSFGIRLLKNFSEL